MSIKKSVQHPAADWRGRAHLGAYTTTEAAWLIETTRQMVVAWWRTAYRHETAPAPTAPANPILLSYVQLVETAVAITLRGSGVSFADIFIVHTRLCERADTDHPFTASALRDDWRPTMQDALALLSNDTRYRWKAALQHRLNQFDYEQGCALRWYPRGREGLIVVDPRIAFGAPTVAGTGIALHIIQERLASNETHAMVAADFGLTLRQVEAVATLTQTLTHRAA